jgi:hypothetical protein
MAEMAGRPRGIEAYRLEGDYLWYDSALSRLRKYGYSLMDAQDYLRSLPDIGAAVYIP